MTVADLDTLLERVERLPDGRIRALASKYIPGQPLGPFRFTGTRPDDPNDLVPHQHRRELRGLRVLAAWLNHFDTKEGNTYDSFVADSDRRYVRHYLFDFGSTLGSAAHGPIQPQTGHENYFDPGDIFVNMISLGLYVRPYEQASGVRFPSTGYINTESFAPEHYEFLIPNPAFSRLTNRDGYWGAKLAMSFSDEQLAAAVAEGEYSDPEAAQHLVEALIYRRDRVGAYWFRQVNPLDRFTLQPASDDRQQLRFVDMAIDTGLEPADGSIYRYRVDYGGETLVDWRLLDSETCVPLPAHWNTGGKTVDRSKLLVVTVHTRRDQQRDGDWGKWVKVFLKPEASSGLFRIIGVRRQE